MSITPQNNEEKNNPFLITLKQDKFQLLDRIIDRDVRLQR